VKKVRTTAAVALLATVALAMAGCGGQSSTTSTASTTTHDTYKTLPAIVSDGNNANVVARLVVANNSTPGSFHGNPEAYVTAAVCSNAEYGDAQSNSAGTYDCDITFAFSSGPDYIWRYTVTYGGHTSVPVLGSLQGHGGG
jgi:ABC-type glycerol-3-phosphate transport system substrate-binding protein